MLCAEDNQEVLPRRLEARPALVHGPVVAFAIVVPAGHRCAALFLGCGTGDGHLAAFAAIFGEHLRRKPGLRRGFDIATAYCIAHGLSNHTNVAWWRDEFVTPGDEHALDILPPTPFRLANNYGHSLLPQRSGYATNIGA
jgi:hypothetical protein